MLNNEDRLAGVPLDAQQFSLPDIAGLRVFQGRE